MNKEGWRLTAIIFIVLFISTWAMAIWGIKMNAEQEELTSKCVYEICEDYPQASYSNGICFCYEYNLLMDDWDIAEQTPLR